MDKEELGIYQMRQRKSFEDTLRKQGQKTSNNWIKYAKWETRQNDLERARSVYERALDCEPRNENIWRNYVEMEMKHKQTNRARNLFDRVTTLLPRADTFWFKYTYMEEMLGNFPKVRQVFDRWMEWNPEPNAWKSYIRFETRYNEPDRAREVYKRFVICHPEVENWVRWARFEERLGELANGRLVFEQAVEYLGDEATEELYVQFAQYEERAKEFERARTIYRYALDHIPRKAAQELYKRFIAFEKQFGDREGIEDVILNKRRFHYEEEVKVNPHNYDAWFDYARLEESHKNVSQAREVYERAIANVPPVAEKRYWRRYIYLWINYALFEELMARDPVRTRQVYRTVLRLVPHQQFSFSKLWLMFAHFEVRQLDLEAARRIFGHALGVAPKPKIFQAYVELERNLGNVDRCRTLFGKLLESDPSNCKAWVDFCALEQSLAESERVRALFELAVEQPVLDLPELVWKAYIDFEIAEKAHEKVRRLYHRLLDRTKHVKVWVSFARFEESIGEPENARSIFANAYTSLKSNPTKEERVVLVQAWTRFEERVGDATQQADVQSKQPKKVKKRRELLAEDGSVAGSEEYWDYIFPDEQEQTPSLKLLEKARAWKRKKLEQAARSAAAQ